MAALHGEIERDYQRWLAGEIERRRALTEATGVDRLTEWLKGVNESAHPREQRQGRLC